MSNYKYMADFCPFSTPVDDPVTYCVMDGKSLDNYFAHGSSQINPYSLKCQAFMSSRCASNWDEKCEVASQNRESRYPNMLAKCGNPPYAPTSIITAGDILVANTAEKKYGKLVGNCTVEREQFDPTVLTSPYIEYQATNNCSYNDCCETIYDVDPSTIDQDPVMNKILDKPEIAAQLLYRLFRQLKKRNELQKIQNTRLGRYYIYQSALYQ